MRWLGLIVLLGVAGCGDDDYNGDSGIVITVDQSVILDLTPLDMQSTDLNFDMAPTD